VSGLILFSWLDHTPPAVLIHKHKQIFVLVLLVQSIDGSGDVNEVAIAHYNDVIDDILAKGEQFSKRSSEAYCTTGM
jgi:hypothetical protein